MSDLAEAREAFVGGPAPSRACRGDAGPYKARPSVDGPVDRGSCSGSAAPEAVGYRSRRSLVRGPSHGWSTSRRRACLSASRASPARSCCGESFAAKALRATCGLGARASSGPFEAHAWVECGGVALNESEPAPRALPPVRRSGCARLYVRRASRPEARRPPVIAGIVSTHRHVACRNAPSGRSPVHIPPMPDTWRNDGEPSVWLSGALSRSGTRTLAPSALRHRRSSRSKAPCMTLPKRGRWPAARHRRATASPSRPDRRALAGRRPCRAWSARRRLLASRLGHCDAFARPRRRSDGPRTAVLRRIRGPNDAGIRVAHQRVASTRVNHRARRHGRATRPRRDIQRRAGPPVGRSPPAVG